MSPNRYALIIEHIFSRNYTDGAEEVLFKRSDINRAAEELGITLPKNLWDVIYSFKYRTPLPDSVTAVSPPGKEWVIVNRGRSKYAFVARRFARVVPDPMLSVTKVPDATPGIVKMYALGDEQALLTRLRYNRLIDIFSGVACYSLQNHLRTTVAGIGQIETDEIYVGVDVKGEHFVFPVQAKGGNDEISVVQIEQDIALCASRYPELTCRPLAAQFMANDVIAIFEFDMEDSEIRKVAERHYRLVLPAEVSESDLRKYRSRQG